MHCWISCRDKLLYKSVGASLWNYANRYLDCVKEHSLQTYFILNDFIHLRYILSITSWRVVFTESCAVLYNDSLQSSIHVCQLVQVVFNFLWSVCWTQVLWTCGFVWVFWGFFLHNCDIHMHMGHTCTQQRRENGHTHELHFNLWDCAQSCYFKVRFFGGFFFRSVLWIHISFKVFVLQCPLHQNFILDGITMNT